MEPLDVINMKPNWGYCVWIMIICFLVRNIYTCTFITTPRYTFTLWQCMIRLRICAHGSLCHIRWFGINMMSMWHPVFLYVSWMWCGFSPDLLIWEFCIWSFAVFKYLSCQERNEECIILSEMQHSQPHMNLYCADFFLIVV